MQQRNLLIFWLALAGLLLLGAQAIGAAPAPSTAGQAGPGQGASAAPVAGNPGRAAPLVFPCGNVWATVTPFPSPVSQAAVTAHNGALYSFSGLINNAGSNRAYRYDPGPDTWTALANLPASRSGANAVSDGTYIYILGGLTAGNLQSTVYRYNPATNTYTTTASLPAAAAYQAAAYLNGKIYSIGGCVVGGCTTFSAAVNVYTIATNTWASGPNYPLALDYSSAVAYNGYVYVAGGSDVGGTRTTKTYRLDPVAGVWDDASIADLPETRGESAGDMLNGRWILAGGRDTFGDLLGAVAWDPVSNTWTTVSGMPTPAFVPGAGTVGGALYVVGGDAYGQVALSRRYTEQPACTVTPTPMITPTATPTLIPFPCGPAWITLTPAPTPVSNSAVAALNGALYSFGGSTNTDTDVSYRYDPGPNLWTQLTSLPAARVAAGAVSDGTSIYILGGSVAGNATNTLYRYDPATNSYTALANLPVSVYAQAVAYLNGKIYRIGGCADAGCASGMNQVDIYTIATNSWASGPAYPIGVANASGVVYNGYIYVAGGQEGNGAATAKTYRLDPVALTWDDAAIADLPATLKEASGDMLNGRWILAGGRGGGGLQGAIAWDPVSNTWSTVNGMPTPAFSIGATTIGSAFYAVGGNAFGLTNVVRRYTEGAACTATPTATVTVTSTPTNTPSVTPTNTPATALLVGHVTWQGRPAQPNALNQLPLTATLRLGANAPVTYPNLTTDASGFFTVSVTTLPTGVYTWWAKGLTYLATNGPVNLTGAAQTQVEMGLQRAGDVNNDNTVDVTDFSLLRATFGLGCGAPGYDGRADWTGDCLVDISDFSLLRGNFGQSGPTP